MLVLIAMILFCCAAVSAQDFKSQQKTQTSQVKEVTHQKLNELLGMSLFDENNDLWSEELEEIQKRLQEKQIYFYQNGDKNGIHLSPVRGKFDLQGVPIEEIRIQTKEQQEAIVPIRVDLILTNKGDSQKTGHLRRDIRKGEKMLVPLIDSKLGKSTRTYYGPASLKQEAQCWNTPLAVFMLETVRGEYMILHIQPPKKKNISRRTFSKKMQAVKNLNLKDNVENTSFGDVYIKNIPLVMQGDKGYCAVACMERILLYYGISNVNMHQMADAAKTSSNNGTSIAKMNTSLRGVFKEAGIVVKSLGDVNIRNFKFYINQGYPILWCMHTSDEYEQRRWSNTVERKNTINAKTWKKQLKKQKMLPLRRGPHACLVIGYNEVTEEIAVSNSWGPNERFPTWISLRDAKRVSQQTSFVYQLPQNERSVSRNAGKKASKQKIKINYSNIQNTP